MDIRYSKGPSNWAQSGIEVGRLIFCCFDLVQLQKSAVLQKTIDFINHLQNTIKKLQNENQHLREALAIGKQTQTSTISPSV